MNIVYYKTQENSVAFTVTEESVETLKEQGIIPEMSSVLVKEYSEDEKSKLIHVDKLKFDSDEEPTEVIFDQEKLKEFFTNEFRFIRKTLFNLLDSYQLRALMKNNKEVVDEIEEDKIALRNLTEESVLSESATPEEFVSNIPQCLKTNYKDKYINRI